MLVQSIRSKGRYAGVKQLVNILLLMFVAQILTVNADCAMDHSQPATDATDMSDHSGHAMDHSLETVEASTYLPASVQKCDCCDDNLCDMVSCNNPAATSAALSFNGRLLPAAMIDLKHRTHLAPDSPSRLRPPIAS